MEKTPALIISSISLTFKFPYNCIYPRCSIRRVHRTCKDVDEQFDITHFAYIFIAGNPPFPAFRVRSRILVQALLFKVYLSGDYIQGIERESRETVARLLKFLIFENFTLLLPL